MAVILRTRRLRSGKKHEMAVEKAFGGPA